MTEPELEVGWHCWSLISSGRTVVVVDKTVAQLGLKWNREIMLWFDGAQCAGKGCCLGCWKKLAEGKREM